LGLHGRGEENDENEQQNTDSCHVGLFEMKL